MTNEHNPGPGCPGWPLCHISTDKLRAVLADFDAGPELAKESDRIRLELDQR